MVEEMVETLWHRANLVYGGRPPAWLDLGHKLVLGDALDPIVGSYDAPTESLDAGRLAYRPLGWEPSREESSLMLLASRTSTTT